MRCNNGQNVDVANTSNLAHYPFIETYWEPFALMSHYAGCGSPPLSEISIGSGWRRSFVVVAVGVVAGGVVTGQLKHCLGNDELIELASSLRPVGLT